MISILWGGGEGFEPKTQNRWGKKKGELMRTELRCVVSRCEAGYLAVPCALGCEEIFCLAEYDRRGCERDDL